MTAKEIREIGLEIDFPKISMRTLFKPLAMPTDRNPFAILQFQKVVLESTVGSIEFEPGTWGLMFNWKGSSIVRSQHLSKPSIVPGRTVFFSRSIKMDVKVAKGDHDSTFILWKSAKLPSLQRWLETWDRHQAYQPMGPVLNPFTSKLFKDSAIELRVAGLIFNTMADLVSQQDRIDLSELPAGLPDVFVHLTNEVRRSPAQYWPVPEAAKLAGYSSHHFSRIFKQLVGYGFQAYVERCRTELAIELLRGSSMTVDSIASKSGFGATQALRDSLREHLGLMPSDLRPHDVRHETKSISR
ncbi:MAG: hypothetical protein RLZ87_158 [Armatimonadota bacterium]